MSGKSRKHSIQNKTIFDNYLVILIFHFEITGFHFEVLNKTIWLTT